MPVSGARTFFLVLVDSAARRFTVRGPMTDDRAWTAQVAAARMAGRRVTCSTSYRATLDDVVRSYANQTGYTYTPDAIV